MKEEVKGVKNPLKEGKKIAVVPIIREGGWLQKINKNHDGAFLFSGSKYRIKGVPYDTVRRIHLDPLTKEEIAYFESDEAGLGIKKGDLSVYKAKNYWSNFEVILTRDPITLDLGHPMDYLRWKFLLVQIDKIAPTYAARKEKGTYKYALKDDEAEQEAQNEVMDIEMQVMEYFSQVKNSERKLKALLTLYYQVKNQAKRVPANATMSFLSTEVYKLLKNDTKTVYEIIKDSDFDERVLVSQAVAAGVINKLSASEYQITGEEDKFNLRELLHFLKLKKNQAVRTKIEAQLETQK